jgi:putative transposase
MQFLACPVMLSEAAGRGRVFSTRRPQMSKRREDATPCGGWRKAMANGLTAEAASRAVGVPRATLYRWEKQPQLRSSRPHHLRSRNWPSAWSGRSSGCAKDFPRCGAAPRSDLWCGPRASRCPTRPSVALSRAWSLCRSPTLRRSRSQKRPSAKRRYAVRPPRDMVRDRPFVDVAPGKAIKHFTAYDPVGNGPSRQPQPRQPSLNKI